MHITVDRDRCCGSGNCVMTAPDVFDQGDADGLVVLREADPPGIEDERVRRAAHLCPAGAIMIG
jgi:ferredoxin